MYIGHANYGNDIDGSLNASSSIRFHFCVLRAFLALQSGTLTDDQRTKQQPFIDPYEHTLFLIKFVLEVLIP